MSDWTKGGFAKVSTDIVPRMIMAISGEEGTGKTTLALGAPGPIALINMDKGIEGIVHKFADGKDIWENRIKLPDLNPKDGPGKAMLMFEPVWTEFVAAWDFGIKNARTLVVDTMTEGYELCRLARFGKLTQVMPHHYQVVNSEINAMINRAFDSDVSLIMTHRMKDEWIDNNKTGKREFSGQKDIPSRVQVHIRTMRDEETGEVSFRVIKCRQNNELWGEVFEEGVATFQFLAQAVFPDTTLEEWE